MIRKLLPVILVLIGGAAGGAAGLILRPAPEPVPEAAAPPAPAVPPDYAKLPSQFVVPVMDSGRVGSLVVMTLSFEVPAGGTEAVFAREPKLRDEFLRVLFDHANTGGFRGTFTDGGTLIALRRALLEAARKVMGPEGVSDILITDIVRQDS